MSWAESKWIVDNIVNAMFTATIRVTCPVGSTVTCERYDEVYTQVNSVGVCQFAVHKAGTWVVCISNGTESREKHVEVSSDGQVIDVEISFVKIYGISKDITQTTPEWARTHEAEGMTATASVGTVAGSSDFDSVYPWCDMQRETLSTGDVMVKIPKFWIKRYREGNIEYIQIADGEKEGFVLPDCFNRPSGVKGCVYIGAYSTSSNNKSVSGATPTVNQIRATMRTNAKAKGVGWSLYDGVTLDAIRILFMVEYATYDAQTAVGRGYCDKTSSGSAIATGSCDNVPNLTGRPAGTNGLVDVVYRGIEGLWGNIWEFVDGVNWNGGKWLICNDPGKYADDTAEGYTELSYVGATNWSQSYIKTLGLDEACPSAMWPTAAGGSATTYMCDGAWSSTGWRVLICSGTWANGSLDGLFTVHVHNASSNTSASLGSRLLYIP